MKALKILTAAVFATFAAAAAAQGFGPGAAGCAAGAAPGAAGCPANGAGPGAGRRGAGMLERLKAADTNADGMISRDEARLALPRLYENFDAIDANKDGLITLEEMQAARLAHRGQAGRGQGWKMLDTDGDGRISREEAAKAPRLSQEFDAIDTDKDGYLSPDELRAARGRFAGRGRPS